jgi:small subunit ribosomal protein S9
VRQILKKKDYSHGTGKRKEAVAQVRLMPGSGAITINGMPFEERFIRTAHRQIIMKPMESTETVGKYDAVIKVAGGGIAGQCCAISHGIARALLNENEKYKPMLRRDGLLTRDSRVKERQKPGLKRARKAPQYTKR